MSKALYGGLRFFVSLWLPLSIFKSFLRGSHGILGKQRHFPFILSVVSFRSMALDQTYSRLEPFFWIPSPVFFESGWNYSSDLARQCRKLRASIFDRNNTAVAFEETRPCSGDTLNARQLQAASLHKLISYQPPKASRHLDQ